MLSRAFIDNMPQRSENHRHTSRILLDLRGEDQRAPLATGTRVRQGTGVPAGHQARSALREGTGSAVPRRLSNHPSSSEHSTKESRAQRRFTQGEPGPSSHRHRHSVATEEAWVTELRRVLQSDPAQPFGEPPRPRAAASSSRETRTHTYSGVGRGKTVPACAIESDTEDETPRAPYRARRVEVPASRPGSFHTRVFEVSSAHVGTQQRDPSGLSTDRRPPHQERSARRSVAVPATGVSDPSAQLSALESAHSGSSVESSPALSLQSPPSGEDTVLPSPPPIYKSLLTSPDSGIAICRIGSAANLNLLGLDLALQRASQATLSPLAEVVSPLHSLPPSYHASPLAAANALPLSAPTLERSLPRLPSLLELVNPHPEGPCSRMSDNPAPTLAMPVPLPTGRDSRRYSAPAVPVRIGYRAPPPPPPPITHYQTTPAFSNAPPVPRRPTQQYIAPKPQTMPDMALRLRALSMASRSSIDRPLPPVPPERSFSSDSQAVSLGEAESPTGNNHASPIEEAEEEHPPAPPPKPLLHYAYHPTHISAYTRDVLFLPTSLHPARDPLPSIIPMPPSPAAFQIMSTSFDDLLQRLFESGTSRIEPTPEVFEAADSAELTAWLRFFKVVHAESADGHRGGRRRMPFRRRGQAAEFRVVLGLQLADAEPLARIESSSSARTPPATGAASSSAPPPGATASSGPNPLLEPSDLGTLESTWFVPITFGKRMPCPCTLSALGEALFKAEQDSRQTGSRADENGEKKLWQVIQSHRVRTESFTDNGVSSAALSAKPSVLTTASSDVRFEDADLVPRGKTKGIFRRMTMVVAEAGSGVGALRSGKKERVRERDMRANFVTPFRPASPS